MAARYWVAGGTGNWSSTTNWSTASGGASGASVPGSADTATFNSSSGTGTATVDSSVTIQTLTMTGFAGTLAFGTNTISLNSTGTVYTGDTTYSVTGTPVINVTSTGSPAISVIPGAVTEANSISFNFTGGTYSLTFLGTVAHAARSVNFTGFSGTWLTIANTSTIYGDLTLSSTMTTTATTNSLYFGATSGTKNITTNGVVILFSILIIGAGGTFKLIDAMTVGNASNIRQAALNSGTIDLNSKTLTCGTFTAGSSNARGVTGPGTISIFGSGAGAFGFGSSPAVTFSGDPVVNLTYSGATATSGGFGSTPENASVSLNVTAGTYTLIYGSNDTVKNINFTGFSGTWNARTSNLTIYGNLTLSTGMTVAASTGTLILGATSGTQVITSNGRTYDGPITINGVGGTVQLADALTMGATRALLLNNGTFDGNNKTISGAASFTMATGSVTAKNISTALAFAHSSGTLTQGAANTTGNYTLTAGTLDLAGFTLTTPSFITAAGTKNLTFNGGTLVISAATTTAWNNAQPTNFTTTAGTGTGKISMTAATAKTFVGGGSTYNCTLSNDGAGALTISGSNTFTTIANGVQPTSFVFTSSTTQTLTNWSVSGTSGNLVTITSSTSGTAATLSQSSGTVSSNYLSLKDSTATGGATWYAGANSTNVSGNSGWLFANAPSASFFFMF
jgi:hypothetical protein